MSRIGKRPIKYPTGVKAALEGRIVKVTGPKGALELTLRPEVEVEVKDGIEVKRHGDDRVSRALHGLTRALLANMVKGVSEGFEKRLEIVGVGYKADVSGSTVNLSLGYSHPVKYALPKGIAALAEKPTTLLIKGIDKHLVGQVAADIRALRPPEPYKGKGIRYAGEVITLKAGKAGKGAAGGK